MKRADANGIGKKHGPSGTRAAFDEATADASPPGREARFKFIPFAEIRPSVECTYLVKGLIPRVGLSIMWGPPKCAKSFSALDLALHVALGWEYRGRRVTQGPVVYVALEGAAGYGARVEAFRREHGTEGGRDVPFFLLPTRLDLVADCDELIESIGHEIGERKLVMVVLDTLNRSLRGSESSDEDMAAYIRACDAIRDAFECAVVVIHHCGVDDRRPRGHTSLAGAADAQLAVKRDGSSGDFTVTVEWLKDGQEGAVLTSRLTVVEVGTDADGDPVTSCVVHPVDGDATYRATPTRKLTDRQRLALDVLTALVATRGEPLPAAFDVTATAVRVTEWRGELFSRGALEHDAKNPREDFRRVKTALQARLLIAEREGHVWLVHP